METTVALPTAEKKVVENISESTWQCPEFKVSGAFSSHMVLQRDKEIVVWGFSDTPGSTVVGSFMG